MNTIPRAVGGLAALVLAAGAGAQEPPGSGDPAASAPQAAAPAFEPGEARGYLGFGLVLVGHTLSTPLGDGDSSGGGIGGRGAGHSARINPSLDIAFTGQVALMGRTADETDEELADVMYEVDGGLRISDLLYLSLGYTTQSTAYDLADLTTTYSVVSIGAGVLHTGDNGYALAQLRVGGGNITNDQDNGSESVGYVGLRGALQRGAPDGVQFMIGLGWDRYDIDEFDFQDDFVRLDFGLGFGL